MSAVKNNNDKHADLLNETATPPFPNILRGESSITLETYQAQQLFHGRSGKGSMHAIIGLLQFASLAGVINECARHSDPYADWWLIRIEKSLSQAQHDLKCIQQTVDHHLNANPKRKNHPAQARKTIRYPLQFSCAYAHQAADLLIQYDLQILSILSARYTAQLDKKTKGRLIFQSGKVVRRAFASVNGFTPLSITRSDMLAMNGKAHVAIAKMGRIPADILFDNRCAEYAPTKITARK